MCGCFVAEFNVLGWWLHSPFYREMVGRIHIRKWPERFNAGSLDIQEFRVGWCFQKYSSVAKNFSDDSFRASGHVRRCQPSLLGEDYISQQHCVDRFELLASGALSFRHDGN